MKIAELMTRKPRTCRSDQSCADAARALWETNCGAIPVVDAEGRLVAMITDRDICMAALSQGKPLVAVPVWVAASRDVVAAIDTDGVEVARALMEQRGLRRIAVVDGGRRVVGVVLAIDLKRNAMAGRRSGRVAVSDVVRKLAVIGRSATTAGADGAPRTARDVQP